MKKSTAQQQFPVFFTEQYLTEKPSFKILKTKFKKKKKKNLCPGTIKSCTTDKKQLKATQLIDENESEEDGFSEVRELVDSNPVALEITVE